jgi:uncharacterized membrane protein YkvA (DUF1232 family)
VKPIALIESPVYNLTDFCKAKVKGNAMNNKKPTFSGPNAGLNIIAELVKRLRLIWLLFTDKRVPVWVKSVLPLSVLYLFSPIDFVPDVLLGLGQLDDLGVLLLGMALFVKLCPADVVEYYTNQLEFGDLHDSETVDATYRVIDED